MPTICEDLLGGAAVMVLGGMIGGVIGAINHARKKSASGKPSLLHEVLADVYWGLFYGAIAGLLLVVIMYFANLTDFRLRLQNLVGAVRRTA